MALSRMPLRVCVSGVSSRARASPGVSRRQHGLGQSAWQRRQLQADGGIDQNGVGVFQVLEEPAQGDEPHVNGGDALLAPRQFGLEVAQRFTRDGAHVVHALRGEEAFKEGERQRVGAHGRAGVAAHAQGFEIGFDFFTHS
jgi:hypothetical protein